MNKPTYEIVTKFDGNDEWTSDGLGDMNCFVSAADAEEGIEQLRALGEEWRAGEYQVHPVTQRSPIHIAVCPTCRPVKS